MRYLLCCLQGRKSDQGPPWLLRQALQPDILASIESPSSTELLHGIYVHLAGSSANTQDLSMHLADMRLGLRCAGMRPGGSSQVWPSVPLPSQSPSRMHVGPPTDARL